MIRKLSFILFCLTISFWVSAQCDLTGLEITTLTCNEDGSYGITWTTDPVDLDVDLYVNSQFYGYYELDSLGVTIDSFLGNGITKDTLVICQNDLDTCCITQIINNPCLCGFANISADIVDCNESDSTFYVILDFEAQNNNSAFAIGGNANNYGTFSYSDTPVTLGPFNADSTEYEFIFFDLDDPLCFDFIDIGIVDCAVVNACQISNVQAEAQTCNGDGTFTVNISFDITNPGTEGFTIQGSGTNYGNYSYGTPPYQIGPLDGDCETIYEFVIIDIANPNCSNFDVLNEPICCPIECALSDLIVEAHSCDEQFFMIDFEFEHQNTSNSFDLFVNGFYYDSFEFGQQFYSAGPFEGGCNVGYEFQVIDSENSSCLTSIFEIGPMICCENDCLFDGISVVVLECDSESIDLDLYFAHIGNSNASINIYSREGLFGEYDLSSFPISLLGFPNTGEMNEYIQVCLTDDPECCEELEWLLVDCEEQCELSNVMISELECNQEEMSFLLNFHHQGTTNTSFDVFSRDGFFGFYSFSELPVTVVDFPNTGFEYEFIKICENDNPDCCVEYEWDVSECVSECEISELSLDLIECDNESMTIVLDFDYSGTTNDFFEVYSRNGLFGTYLFTDLPLTINNFPNTGFDFEFIGICENDNPNECCAEWEWDVTECAENGECELSELTVDLVECNEESMTIIIDFQYTGTTNAFFEVYSRNGLFGTYLFSDLPLTINNFPNTGADFEFIRVCENDNPNECCTAWEWDVTECSENDECEIFDVVIDQLDCDSVEMTFVLDFEYNGTTNDFFDVFSRNGFFGFYSFEELPITLVDFPNTGSDYEFIKICENDNPNCCVEFEWLLEDCEGSVHTIEKELNDLSLSIHNSTILLSQKVASIELFDTLGRKLNESSNTNQLNINNLTSSIYFIRLSIGQSQKTIKVFL